MWRRNDTQILNKPDPYEPTSRRPIAAMFRRTADRAVQVCIRWKIHPDAISCASIVASTIAGAMFLEAWHWPILLVLAPLFCFLRLWFNMLDGMVALGSGTASLRGEILNDLPDRISDVLIFAGVAHSGLTHMALAYWAAILALLTAYVGIFGQALGGRREFGGVMSKPWRMVMLAVGAWTTFLALRTRGTATFGGLTVLDWACVIIILGCVQTVWVRLAHIMRSLSDRR